MSLKTLISHSLFNLPGWHTNRHIVVFESDDWGAIRMPSLETLNKLQSNSGYVADRYGYDTNDTLASNEDLELLMDALSTVKDMHGHPAKITLNCCVANPDFKRIYANKFQEYYYEPFTETLNRYPNHDRSFELWKEGIRHKVFQPQFHGREHLNAKMWMLLLQKNVDNVRKAFDQEVYSMDVHENNDPRKHVLSAFNVLNKEDYDFARHSIKEGLDLFEKLFGFRSLSMIAPCYTWDREIEDEAYLGGVRVIQGGHAQITSAYAKSRGIKSKRHYTGQINQLGQVYLIRTCYFEPTQNPSYNADSCLREIGLDFSFHKPSIVSCHRLNFIGELNKDNRDENLREFKRLLKNIVKEYPDVEFMSSDELGSIILNK